ncbi:MAG: ApeI family dehydratase [Panacagrimonas sp.]
MTTLPQILGTRHGASHAGFDLRIPPELHYFEGHFPGFPLLPGVVQIAWVEYFGRQCFELDGAVRRLLAIKFQKPILPAQTAALELDYDASRTELAFRYRVGSDTCSSGRLAFDSHV